MSSHFDSTDAPRGLAASCSTGYLSRLPSPVLLPIVSSLEANPDFSWLEQPSPAGPTKSMLMAGRLWLPARARQENLEDGHVGTRSVARSVSYTHLTLPTIYSV